MTFQGQTTQEKPGTRGQGLHGAAFLQSVLPDEEASRIHVLPGDVDTVKPVVATHMVRMTMGVDDQIGGGDIGLHKGPEVPDTVACVHKHRKIPAPQQRAAHTLILKNMPDVFPDFSVR